MARYKIERWKCDRCGLDLANKPPHCGEEYKVSISVDWTVAGGIEIGWSELCAPCNERVRELVKMLKSEIPK